MKLIMLIALLLFSGCQLTGKYSAPVVEDCINLASYNVETGQTIYRCGCIDRLLTAKSYPTLVKKVSDQMSNHPDAELANQYMYENEDKIVEKQNYILPAWYCRGYSSTSARNRETLENWANTNRVERIKCEKRR